MRVDTFYLSVQTKASNQSARLCRRELQTDLHQRLFKGRGPHKTGIATVALALKISLFGRALRPERIEQVNLSSIRDYQRIRQCIPNSIFMTNILMESSQDKKKSAGQIKHLI